MKRLIFLICILFISGCKTELPFTYCLNYDNSRLENQLKKKTSTQYPKKYLLNQRLIIKINDHENSLSAYALINDDQTKVVLTTDIGGSILKISKHKSKGNKVEKNLSSWSNDILFQGIVRDVELIYRNPFIHDCQLGKRRNGQHTLYENIKDIHYELIFNKMQQLHHLVAACKGQTVYEIYFKDYKQLGNWETPIPTLIEIVDHKKSYSVTVITNTLDLR